MPDNEKTYRPKQDEGIIATNIINDMMDNAYNEGITHSIMVIKTHFKEFPYSEGEEIIELLEKLKKDESR